jgi:hypothetical protein
VGAKVVNFALFQASVKNFSRLPDGFTDSHVCYNVHKSFSPFVSHFFKVKVILGINQLACGKNGLGYLLLQEVRRSWRPPGWLTWNNLYFLLFRATFCLFHLWIGFTNSVRNILKTPVILFTSKHLSLFYFIGVYTVLYKERFMTSLGNFVLRRCRDGRPVKLSFADSPESSLPPCMFETGWHGTASRGEDRPSPRRYFLAYRNPDRRSSVWLASRHAGWETWQEETLRLWPNITRPLCWILQMHGTLVGEMLQELKCRKKWRRALTFHYRKRS